MNDDVVQLEVAALMQEELASKFFPDLAASVALMITQLLAQSQPNKLYLLPSLQQVREGVATGIKRTITFAYSGRILTGRAICCEENYPNYGLMVRASLEKPDDLYVYVPYHMIDCITLS